MEQVEQTGAKTIGEGKRNIFQNPGPSIKGNASFLPKKLYQLQNNNYFDFCGKMEAITVVYSLLWVIANLGAGKDQFLATHFYQKCK